MARERDTKRSAQARGIFDVTTRRMRPVRDEDIENARDEHVAELEREDFERMRSAKRLELFIALAVCVVSLVGFWIAWGLR